MKTAYIIGEFPSISETFILREINALKEKGNHITIFALKKGKPPYHADAEKLMEHVYYRRNLFSIRLAMRHFCILACRPSIYIHALTVNLKKTTNNKLKLFRNFLIAGDLAYEGFKQNIDHIHAHFAFLPADVGLLVSQLMNIGFSFSAHARDIYTQSKKALSDKVINAQFIVVCTQHGKNHLQNLFPKELPEKFIMLHHGLPLQDFTPEDSKESFIIGIGRLKEKKGFHYLVETCRLLTEKNISFQCQIVGEGPQKKKIQSLIRQYGLEKNIHLPGKLTQDDIIALYRRAAVLVVPSIIATDGDRDGLPNVILEALAMQVPVVATSVAGIPELVRDGINGFLVNPEQSDMLADRIQRILTDSKLRQNMGKNGRMTIEEDFDILKNVDRLCELFHGTPEIHKVQTTRQKAENK